MARKTESQIETMGQADGRRAARAFVAGTRAERRAIRTKFAANRWNDSAYWVARNEAFINHLEAGAQHIKAGKLPRMIRPSKIFALINRAA